MDEIWVEVEGVKVGLVGDRQAIVVRAPGREVVHEHRLCEELRGSAITNRAELEAWARARLPLVRWAGDALPSGPVVDDGREAFAASAAFLLGHVDEVLADPAMAGAMAPCIKFGTSVTGPAYTDLGILLDVWRRGALVVDSECRYAIHVFAGGCSPLSGNNWVRGVVLPSGQIRETSLPSGGDFSSRILSKLAEARRSAGRAPADHPITVEAVLARLRGRGNE